MTGAELAPLRARRWETHVHPSSVCDYVGRSLHFPGTPSTYPSVKWGLRHLHPRAAWHPQLGAALTSGSGGGREDFSRPWGHCLTAPSSGLQAQSQHPSVGHHRGPYHHAPGDAREGQHVRAEGEPHPWSRRPLVWVRVKGQQQGGGREPQIGGWGSQHPPQMSSTQLGRESWPELQSEVAQVSSTKWVPIPISSWARGKDLSFTSSLPPSPTGVPRRIHPTGRNW